MPSFDLPRIRLGLYAALVRLPLLLTVTGLHLKLLPLIRAFSNSSSLRCALPD